MAFSVRKGQTGEPVGPVLVHLSPDSNFDFLHFVTPVNVFVLPKFILAVIHLDVMYLKIYQETYFEDEYKENGRVM